MGWLIAVVVIGGALCLWGIISPQSLYWKGHAWQYRNPGANEPSEISYGLTRLTSVIALVGLLVGGTALWGFAREDSQRANCRDVILPAFEKEVWNKEVKLAAVREFAAKYDLTASVDTPNDDVEVYTLNDGDDVILTGAVGEYAGRMTPSCGR